MHTFLYDHNFNLFVFLYTISLTVGHFCPVLTRFITVQLQIEEVSRKLRSGDLGIPANPEERCSHNYPTLRLPPEQKIQLKYLKKYKITR